VTGASTFNSGITFGAGTTTVAPIDLTAGTNLTTAIAGAIEYDGRVIYGTPQSTQRGVIPGAQFFRLDSNLVGANVNTAQNVFGVGVTLSANTVYAFEAVYDFAKTAGTTSHAIGLGFGGTATLNNFSLGIIYGNNPVAAGGGVAPSMFVATSTANQTYTSATTTAAVDWYTTFRGTLSVNAGGTFIPQYTLTAAPGGAYSTVAGSYFLIYPIGASGANISVGTWA
jgi:hypothetical protein